ncbi:tyrosine-type recombinase/integrase [Flavobacterium sp.]
MPKINVFLLNEYRSEYKTEYGLNMKKNYSEPKIYDANGDLTRRWYVYFSFRNPETGKLAKQTPVYGNANTFKTKAERYEILNAYRKSIEELLLKGLNPYDKQSNLANSSIAIPNGNTVATANANTIATANSNVDESTNSINVVGNNEDKDVSNVVLVSEDVENTIATSFALGLKIKKSVLSKTSYPSFSSSVNRFEKWLFINGFAKEQSIIAISKKTVIKYLNEVLENTTPRTRNNTRIDLSSLFQVLEDNEIIKENFIKKINVLKATPERNKTYTSTLQEKIFEYMEANDKILLLFVKFISYNYLRPIEVCRLKVGDIDLKDRKLYVKAKNSPVKTKIIPEILIKELPDLSNLNREHNLFTPFAIGEEWLTSETDKRNYFSKRFKKVKDHFNLGKEYGLYSFRHTFITKLYSEFAKAMTPYEAKSKLMLITGHGSMDALENYLRDIDAVLPEDYSSYLNKK